MNNIEQNIWGFTEQGEAVLLYTMTNAQGAVVKLSNFGATIVSIEVPDRDGKKADVALGYDDFHSYYGDGPCMGKTVGRFANRIGNARFTLDGVEYHLTANCNGGHHIHGGGIAGFANKIWESRVETDRVVFSLFSPDGDQGYPGDLNAEVVYDWSDDNELEITYYAKSSAPTIVNLTNHSYFNLKGEDQPGAMDQLLQLNAKRYLRYDASCVCTGELIPIEGTPMDFSQPKALSREIDADYEPLRFGSGYDQSWAIEGYEKGKLSEAGILYDPESGRRLRILTTQPSIHIYAGNFMQGCPRSISGHEYGRRAGVAIECQAYPNSPNRPNFPCAVLRPGETYNEKIIFRFETDK
ncbi:MAG: galactose mutarotase [Alistipes sp.]|nr:galactose mutarotase [Alistipes sp.]